MEFNVTTTIDLSEMLAAGCRRCHKALAYGDVASIRYHRPSGRRKAFIEDGDTMFSITVYHQKCVPPVWFHRDQQVAGSRPARQSPAALSLSNEHDATGD